MLHGLEEYTTKFYDVYPLLNFKWMEDVFNSIPQASFLTFQIMWWLLLMVLYLSIRGNKSQFFLMILVGIIYIYECTHILSAILLQGYTSGFTTGLLFPFMTFFYWRELVSNWKQNE